MLCVLKVRLINSAVKRSGFQRRERDASRALLEQSEAKKREK